MFSPKVLDRAFVLELGHVDLLSFGARPVTPRPDDLLLREAPFPLVALDRTSALDWEQFGRMRQGSLRRMVTDLHDLLQEDGRGFGYRVAGELARFVALAEEFGCQTDQELTHALDLAILMKVLPRLHGAQQELERPLCRLLSFACTGADPRGGVELLERWRPDGGGRLVSQAEGTPARLPRSAHKLHRMLVRLRQRGFVSYIE
jgi:5-methylcytosine-specific restriction protein B